MVSVLSPETMFTQPAPSREIFLGRLQTIGDIASSDNRNLLLNDQLEATEKWGLRWIVRVILTPICYLFCDLFYHERMNRVAQKLQEFLHVNQHYFADSNSLRGGIRDITNRIITPLQTKTHGNFNMVLNGILTESNNRLAELERADFEVQQAGWQTTQAEQQEALENLRLQLQQQGAFTAQQVAWQTTQAEQQEALETQRLQLQQQQGAFQADQAGWQTTQAEQQEALETLRMQLQQQQGAFQAELAGWQTTQAQQQEALETLRMQLQEEQAAWQTTQVEQQEALETQQNQLLQQRREFQEELAGWQTTQVEQQEALETQQNQLLQQQREFQTEQTEWQVEKTQEKKDLEEERKRLEELEEELNQRGIEMDELLELWNKMDESSIQRNKMDESSIQSQEELAIEQEGIKEERKSEGKKELDKENEEFEKQIDVLDLGIAALERCGSRSGFSPDSERRRGSVLEGIDVEEDSWTDEEAEGEWGSAQELKEKMDHLLNKGQEANRRNAAHWKLEMELVEELKTLRQELAQKESQSQATSQSSSEGSADSFV